MVTPRTYDAHHGFSASHSPRDPAVTNRYLVVLTSDEERVSQEVQWTPEIAAAVSALAQSINSQATWSASPRMYVTPVPATQQGEVA